MLQNRWKVVLSDIIPLGETKYSSFDIQFRRHVSFLTPGLPIPLSFLHKAHFSRQLNCWSRLSALLKLHLHSPLNTWLQCVAQRQLQAETRKIWVFGASYIRYFTVMIFHCSHYILAATWTGDFNACCVSQHWTDKHVMNMSTATNVAEESDPICFISPTNRFLTFFTLAVYQPDVVADTSGTRCMLMDIWETKHVFLNTFMGSIIVKLSKQPFKQYDRMKEYSAWRNILDIPSGYP